mgnify:CR=1 FL=1
MHVRNNPDFKSIWQLAHDWTGENPDQTNPSAISFELRLAIDRLIRAIGRGEISACWKGYRILENNSFLTFILDFRHFIKFFRWLIYNKFSKDYLENLYVKRNEVITWCEDVALLDPPPCWAPKLLSYELTTAREAKNYRPADETEDRIRCQAIASTLWALDATIHPIHIARSKILQRIGNGAQYDISTITDWIAELDPQKDCRKTGRPPKAQYVIKFEMIPQSKK